MSIHIAMLFLACASLARLLVKAVQQGFRWGVIARPLGFTLVFLGLWLISSVIHDARPGKGDAEGRWLASDRSRVVILHRNGTLESLPDGQSGTWRRLHRDAFSVSSFDPYSGGRYDPETDAMSLSRTGTGSRGKWVRHDPFERVTEANAALANRVIAGTAAPPSP